MNFKDIKLQELIRQLAAEFLQLESNKSSLVTVTRVELGQKLNKATILITVLPEEKEKEAVDFARRKRTEFRKYVTEHAKIGHVPFFDFDLDLGEKNRQRIEEISKVVDSK